MFPFLFKHEAIVIPTFFTMMMLGVLAATFYLYFRAPKLGFSQVVALDIGIFGAVFGVIGGRLFHVFAEAWWFYREDPWRILDFWRGGFVSFGAFIGGAVAVLLYLRMRRLPVLKYADFTALSLPLLVMFIRVGCLGAGCCYGKPTDSFFHLIFPGPHYENGPPTGVPVHPTQVYDFLNGLVVFVFLNWLYPRRRFDGQIALLFFILYSTIRFMIEFLRGDADRGLYFHDTISTGQMTGGLVIIFCLICYAILERRSLPLDGGGLGRG